MPISLPKQVHALFKNRIFLPAILLVFLCLITYGNTLFNGISWDDRAFLITWKGIQQTSPDYPVYLNIPELLGGDLPEGHQGVFRPLRSMFYLLSYSIWGDNYFGYHLQSIIFHTLISLLVFAIAARLSGNRLLGFATAAIFAVHPIHTEAVSYITASFDTLGILFFFLSFYFYLKSREDIYKKQVYIFASVLYFGISAFFYEMTLTLPILIALYEFIQNSYSIKTTLKQLPLYRHYLIIIIFYLYYRFIVASIGNRADYLGQLWYLAAVQARIELPLIYHKYASLMIYPAGLTIVHEMTNNLAPVLEQIFNRIDPSKTLTGFTIRNSIGFIFIYIGAFLGLSKILSFGSKPIFFAFCWFFITLLPVSSIQPQGAVVAERFLYIPSFGFFLALVLIAHSCRKQLARFVPSKIAGYFFGLILVSVIAAYSIRTITRNFDWFNEITIWDSAIKINADHDLPYLALADFTAANGDREKGIEYLITGVQNLPKNPRLRLRLAETYIIHNKYDQALKTAEDLIEVNPESSSGYKIIGYIHQKNKNFEQAEQAYLKSVEYNPNDYQTYLYLGDLANQREEYKKAYYYYLLASQITPTSKIFFVLGVTAERIGLLMPAELHLKKAIELFPGAAENYLELANLYLKTGRNDLAREILAEGIIETEDEILKKSLQETVK